MILESGIYGKYLRTSTFSLLLWEILLKIRFPFLSACGNFIVTCVGRDGDKKIWKQIHMQITLHISESEDNNIPICSRYTT